MAADKIIMVALPTEGVDRNENGGSEDIKEIAVALPTEGVDRNSNYLHTLTGNLCRPPHGGRG